MTVAISTFGASASFTLPYEAGQAVAFGLPWEDGLAAITSAPAAIFGLGDRLGTIEPGKIANLVVTDGDPLEIRTRTVHVMIGGRLVDLANKHTRSYDLYRSRPLPRAYPALGDRRRMTSRMSLPPGCINASAGVCTPAST